LVLHIFYVESRYCTFAESFDRKMEPSSILVFGVVNCDPHVELLQILNTLLPLIFSAL